MGTHNICFLWRNKGNIHFVAPIISHHGNFSIQSNLDGSNTDGSFTMANSNSFLSPHEVLPIAQENKYLGKFSYFIEAILMSTLNIQSLFRKSKRFP